MNGKDSIDNIMKTSRYTGTKLVRTDWSYHRVIDSIGRDKFGR